MDIKLKYGDNVNLFKYIEKLSAHAENTFGEFGLCIRKNEYPKEINLPTISDTSSEEDKLRFKIILEHNFKINQSNTDNKIKLFNLIISTLSNESMEIVKNHHEYLTAEDNKDVVKINRNHQTHSFCW